LTDTIANVVQEPDEYGRQNSELARKRRKRILSEKENKDGQILRGACISYCIFFIKKNESLFRRK
jgi:uncharacterized protein YnzC (UPF0291/DUF896 family)